MKRLPRRTLLLLALLGSSALAFADPTPRASSRTTVNLGPTYDVNVNRSTNSTRHSDYAGGYDAYGHDYHPIDMTVAATANVMPTPAPVGAIRYNPPPDYSAVVMGGVTYMKSGAAWYQPQFTGTAMTYVVIPSLN